MKNCLHCGEAFGPPANTRSRWKYRWQQFCSAACAQDAYRGTRCVHERKRTSPELAGAIARLLLTDRGAQDLFNKLVGRCVF